MLFASVITKLSLKWILRKRKYSSNTDTILAGKQVFIVKVFQVFSQLLCVYSRNVVTTTRTCDIKIRLARKYSATLPCFIFLMKCSALYLSKPKDIINMNYENKGWKLFLSFYDVINSDHTILLKTSSSQHYKLPFVQVKNDSLKAYRSFLSTPFTITFTYCVVCSLLGVGVRG